VLPAPHAYPVAQQSEPVVHVTTVAVTVATLAPVTPPPTMVTVGAAL
jgi:hypothetical protein